MGELSRRVDPDLLTQIALRRVRRGGVTRSPGAWLVGGRPVPAYLDVALGELLVKGLLALSEPGLDTLRRVGLTAAGQARWEQLCHPHEPVFETPDGRRSSEPAPEAPGGHPVPTRISDPELALLLRQTQWALDEAAYACGGGLSRQRRRELAATLEELAVIVRASVVPDGGS